MLKMYIHTYPNMLLYKGIHKAPQTHECDERTKKLCVLLKDLRQTNGSTLSTN